MEVSKAIELSLQIYGIAAVISFGVAALIKLIVFVLEKMYAKHEKKS